MRTHDQNFGKIFLSLLLTLAAAFGNSYTMAADIKPDPLIIAKVNGVPIYSSDLPPVNESRISQYRQLGSKSSLETLKKQFQRKDLENLVDQELLSQAGAASGNKQEIEYRLENRLAAVVKQANEKTDVSANSRKEKLRKEVQREIYLEKSGILTAKPDEQELRQFYEANPKSFTEPLSIKVRHILVQVPIGAPKNIENKARSKADKILDDVKSGKDFAALAQQFSDCSSKTAGGDLGLIKQGYMPKDFDSVAFAMKPGETSGVVKSRYGFHIIRIEEIVPEKTTAFKEVREYISGYLQKGSQQRKLGELIHKLRKTAKIEIFSN